MEKTLYNGWSDNCCAYCKLHYFEHTHSEKLINGFISGKQSQRGVHTVTGGMEEKEISIKYREDASKLHIYLIHILRLYLKSLLSVIGKSLYVSKKGSCWTLEVDCLY